MNSEGAPGSPELPPYTHVPGRTPHPISDPAGHMHQHHAADTTTRTNQQWFDDALHLFQQGYYWEAHEAWEQLWIALGRKGETANLVKGLIKLAASGVKMLECNPIGAQRHATRALELLTTDQPELFGLTLTNAKLVAERFLQSPTKLTAPSDGKPTVLPGFSLASAPSA